jgi:hypothetical protein
MANFNSTKRDGLYQQKGSRFWYMSYMENGKRVRITTRTDRYDKAQEILNKRREIEGVRANGEHVVSQEAWIEFVTSSYQKPKGKSWIYIMYRRAQGNSKNRRTKVVKGCTLTPEDVRDIALRSNGKCMVTGIAFNWPPAKRRFDPLMPSLDRIDQSKGYTADNCRMVLMAVNFAMNRWGEDILMLIAKGMLQNNTMTVYSHSQFV